MRKSVKSDIGIKLLAPKRFGDSRGFFAETYNFQRYEKFGITERFVQDNHSVSKTAGTVRGLHFQCPPAAQGKLIRCGRGAIFDVAVDIRIGSPTFGAWEGYELTEENGHQLFIPIGFAHGFLTLEPNSEIVYKCTDYYSPETERTILWNDPDIKIDWPTFSDYILSDKDKAGSSLQNFKSPFVWHET